MVNDAAAGSSAGDVFAALRQHLTQTCHNADRAAPLDQRSDGGIAEIADRAASILTGQARQTDAAIGRHDIDRICSGGRNPVISRLLAHGVAFSAILAGSIPAFAQAPSEQHRQIDAVFSRWAAPNSPGCALSVVHRGATVAERVYGMADLDLSVPARTDSVYEAGSTSKQFTAAAIILLARDGKLGLDDDIRKYLPEMPNYGTRITIRHMIHHVSGLRDWGGVTAVEGWPRDSRTVTNADVLQIMARQKGLNFVPGSHYLYSNTNYNLLAIIVQRVSGQTLAAFTKARIFTPLGMTETRWRDDHNAVVPRRAQAYVREGAGYVLSQPIEDAYGNGGLLTTIRDLQLWNAAIESDKFGPGFGAAMEEQINFTGGGKLAYAAGLFKLSYNGTPEIAHPGATGGYRAWLGRYPAHRLSIALLCNAGDADTIALARRVADIYLPPYPAPTPSLTQPYRPEGVYVNSVSGFPTWFGNVGGRLSIGGQVLDVTGPGQWRFGTGTLSYDARQQLVLETQEGDRIPYRKVKFTPPANAAAYVGRYCSVDNSGCWVVSASGRTSFILPPRGTPIRLDIAYGDVFTLATGSMVQFLRNGSGHITGLNYSDPRDYDMRFAKVGVPAR
jgi:CubicO group peptidase (beta-lactamase class C family)